MREFDVRPRRSDESLARDEQLAGRIAHFAAHCGEVDDDVREMVINRVIDDAAVAAASLERAPVSAARDQALAHPDGPGAALWGAPRELRVAPEWAAWANSVAVRELDFHDTFLAEEYAHPGDNIPAMVAVAQHCAGRFALSGRDLVRAVAVGYEVQIDLCRAISLHAHKIDHVAHLGPSIAAGLGSLLGLDETTIYHAVGQALHLTTATRQSRKGEISTWKAYAPAFAAKVAIEAVDRAMRSQTAPAPIYEGEDGVIAWMLDGPDANYRVALPEDGESPRAIMESFTKAYSAEYQAQAWIDAAIRLHREHPELRSGELIDEVVITSSHHTHAVIGSGSRDPQKYDPAASRETLDHSLPYIFAVALQDGAWHHERSYRRERAQRRDTVELWRRIRTEEGPEWSRRYLTRDATQRSFGGRVTIRLRRGDVLEMEQVMPDAHPLGARPFERDDYVQKFTELAGDVLDEGEITRFLAVATRLGDLSSLELSDVTFVAPANVVGPATTRGIF